MIVIRVFGVLDPVDCNPVYFCAKTECLAIRPSGEAIMIARRISLRQRGGAFILSVAVGATVAALVGSASPTRAQQQTFGTATDFNLLLFGNHKQSGTDVW